MSLLAISKFQVLLMSWDGKNICRQNLAKMRTTLPRSSRNENEIVKISVFNVIKMKGRVLLACDHRHCAQEEKREIDGFGGLNSSAV